MAFSARSSGKGLALRVNKFESACRDLWVPVSCHHRGQNQHQEPDGEPDCRCSSEEEGEEGGCGSEETAAMEMREADAAAKQTAARVQKSTAKAANKAGAKASGSGSRCVIGSRICIGETTAAQKSFLSGEVQALGRHH